MVVEDTADGTSHGSGGPGAAVVGSLLNGTANTGGGGGDGGLGVVTV